MKIHVTKKEYRLLVDMLYLSDWIMHSHCIGDEQRHHEYEKLRKSILSHYKEMGAEDIIEYSKENDAYYETRDYDDYIHEKFINAYNEEIFWEGLIDKLIMRDLIKEIGVEKYNTMEEMERFKKISEVEERYANEFTSHGLENVKIVYDENLKT
jgi:hypothetical protein